MVNSDCQRTKACIRNKCQDPCIGSCGKNAICRVVNHSPICTCVSGYSGDPFTYCSIIRKRCKKKRSNDLTNKIFLERPIEFDPEPVNPCIPSPCGPNSQCHSDANSNLAVCSCLPSFIGRSPNCRPECTVNSDCPSNLGCMNQKCVNPCIGSCGLNANCMVSSHVPICTCFDGYSGDPFVQCQQNNCKKRQGVSKELFL